MLSRAAEKWASGVDERQLVSVMRPGTACFVRAAVLTYEWVSLVLGEGFVALLVTDEALGLTSKRGRVIEGSPLLRE